MACARLRVQPIGPTVSEPVNALIGVVIPPLNFN